MPGHLEHLEHDRDDGCPDHLEHDRDAGRLDDLVLQVVEGFKKNEEQLKHYVSEYKTKLKNQDQVYC